MGVTIPVPLVDQGPYYEVRGDGTVVVTPLRGVRHG